MTTDDTAHWGPAGVPPLDDVPDAVWSRVLSVALDPGTEGDPTLVPDAAAFDGVVADDGSSADLTTVDGASSDPVEDGAEDGAEDGEDDTDGAHHDGLDDVAWSSDEDREHDDVRHDALHHDPGHVDPGDHTGF